MWFRNLIVYRLPEGWAAAADDLESKLSQHPLQPCGGLEMESRGWLPPQEGGAFLYRSQRHWLLALGTEQKLLPRSVGRKQMRDLVDKVATELMPRALARRRITHGWIDSENGWLAIDTAGDAGAEQFLETLRRADEKLPAVRLEMQRSP